MGMQIAIGMEISLLDRMLAGKAWTGHQRVLHRNCLCVARTIAGLSAVLVVQRMFWWTMKTMNDGWCSVWDEWGWFYVKFSTSVQAIWNVNISMYHHTLKKSNDITHIMQPVRNCKNMKTKNKQVFSLSYMYFIYSYSVTQFTPFTKMRVNRHASERGETKKNLFSYMTSTTRRYK